MYRNGEHKLKRLVFPLVYIVHKFEKEGENNMKIKIEKLPSGFYVVRVNDVWIDASSATLETAKEKANTFIAAENKRQNARNSFSNITLEIAC